MSVAEAARQLEDGDAEVATPPEGAGGVEEPDRDLEDADELGDPEPEGIVERLTQPLEGSINEDRIGELYNPEQGGANRLVLTVEEIFGFSEGLPRAAHLVIGAVELAQEPPAGIADLTGKQSSSNDEDEDAAPTPQESSNVTAGDTQEIINYDN